MKFVFVDAEYTGEHTKTTLVSLGLVGINDESLYVTLNDYDRDQVTPWLREKVLSLIDSNQSVNRKTAFQKVSSWLEKYAAGEKLSLISAGKTHDLTLLFELWHEAFPERKYFHNLYCLPDYLNHSAHFDLPTIFFLAGVDPGTSREEFIDHAIAGKKHDALYDAKVVKECFKKCLTTKNFPNAKFAL